MPSILDSLPPLYRTILPAFFEREIPAESKATCSNCAMCESTKPSVVTPVDGSSRIFRPDTKCCTYHPRIPNYLVGGLLCDEDPAMDEGRRRVRERLKSRIGVEPLAMRAPAKFTALYNNSRRTFGRAASLRCPYFESESGNCTVWRYRESICSTFFCKFVAGADGWNFWNSTKVYLGMVENVLARYAAYRLFPEHLLDGRHRSERLDGPLTAADLDESPPSLGEHAALWDEWTGREEEFYRACFDIVKAISREELDRILGFDGAMELAILEKRHFAATSTRLPDMLRFDANATVQWLPDGSVAFGAYSEYDAVALPGSAYALLVAFTGADPVSEVRRRLRDEKQADLDDEVLLTLYRHRVLVEA